MIFNGGDLYECVIYSIKFFSDTILLFTERIGALVEKIWNNSTMHINGSTIFFGVRLTPS